jgi:hypothetical protein
VALFDQLATYAADHFPQEWRVLTGAPRLFAVLVILGWMVGGTAFWLYFRRKIDLLKARVEDQSERLRLLPNANRFDHLTNRELRREAREMIANLRELVERGRREWTSIFFPKQGWWEKQPPKPDDGSLTEAKMRFYDRFRSEYEGRFRIGASLVRDELFRRIPQKKWPHKAKYILDSWNPADGDKPLGAWEMVDMADDLERLTSTLSSRLRKRRKTETHQDT